MVCGWRAAYDRMEAEPGDAYLLGTDSASGTRVAISGQRLSAYRIFDTTRCQDDVWSLCRKPPNVVKNVVVHHIF
jgi:hypothetical protein